MPDPAVVRPHVATDAAVASIPDAGNVLDDDPALAFKLADGLLRLFAGPVLGFLRLALDLGHLCGAAVAANTGRASPLLKRLFADLAQRLVTCQHEASI